MTDADGNLEATETFIQDELSSLRQRLNSLERRESELLKSKEESERVFSEKRSRFKELFLQKEEELQQEHMASANATERLQSLEEELSRVKNELEGVRTAAALSEVGKVDEIELMRQQYSGEVDSIQQIMKEAAEDATQRVSYSYEEEKKLLIRNAEKLDNQVSELKNQLSRERDGFLSSVAKTLQKKVGTQSPNTLSEHESLEISMKKAEQDAEILRSVVMPLEEEISSLRDRLMDAMSRIHDLEAQLCSVSHSTSERLPPKSPSLQDLDLTKDPEERLKDVLTYFKAEKAARTDLEMFVAVLNTQKSVLQEDGDKLRNELQEVCHLLEGEKRRHAELKCTWQMANDQFLHSQRLMMMDMRRMEGLLSTEQQRQITELKHKDTEREAQEKKLREVEEKQRRKSEQIDDVDCAGETGTMSTDLPDSASIGDDISINEEICSLNHAAGDHPPSEENLFTDSGVHETRSLQDANGQITIVAEDVSSSLSEAQIRAIRDLTPELEARQSLLASAKAQTDTLSMEGKRLVSDKEWELLQQEVKSARDKLGLPCDMCSNYEDQLQNVQQELKETLRNVNRLQRSLDSERQTSANQLKYQEELETQLKTAADDMDKQISSLFTKVSDCDRYLCDIKDQYQKEIRGLHDQLKTLTQGRDEANKELVKLQTENDSLVGKHSKHAAQLQSETINLPNNLEEMQLLLLQYREEIITAKVAKEYTEKTLKSEILFLKDQLVAEQQEKNNLEETLSQEVSSLQEQVGSLSSLKPDLERESSARAEAETKLRETDSSLRSIQTKSKQLIQALQSQVDEQANIRTKLERETYSLRNKVQSLQVDLDNSEAVQRDFVKLSQSLQIQLEKIRQAETEVRWQHEEDVDDCTNCHQLFTVTKRKHHCRHCGKIFCSDCNSKSVNSGPNFRPSRVCDVCHTILVNDATPYFSTELPPTPD